MDDYYFACLVNELRRRETSEREDAEAQQWLLIYPDIPVPVSQIDGPRISCCDMPPSFLLSQVYTLTIHTDIQSSVGAKNKNFAYKLLFGGYR